MNAVYTFCKEFYIVETKKRVIALGFFDGVHLGHGALLKLCKQRSEELGAIPAAFTFDVSPASLIQKKPVPLLTTPPDRARIMRLLYGMEEVIVAHYDERMMRTPWRDFVVYYLVRDHGAVHLVAGHDFHFGYRGEGDPQKLQALCAELGVSCDIVPRVELEGITVSSTYIRSLIAGGEMARAVRFLGHPFVLTDKVAHGKKLGTTLGFPTVNLHLPEGLICPRYGVYVTEAVLENGETYPAVTNIGVRPTVDDGNTVTVETFLLHFQGDLYGREVRLHFHDFLRPERKFASLEELRAEVMHNTEQAEAFFRG